MFRERARQRRRAAEEAAAPHAGKALEEKSAAKREADRRRGGRLRFPNLRVRKQHKVQCRKTAWGSSEDEGRLWDVDDMGTMPVEEFYTEELARTERCSRAPAELRHWIVTMNRLVRTQVEEQLAIRNVPPHPVVTLPCSPQPSMEPGSEAKGSLEGATPQPSRASTPVSAALPAPPPLSTERAVDSLPKAKAKYPLPKYPASGEDARRSLSPIIVWERGAGGSGQVVASSSVEVPLSDRALSFGTMPPSPQGRSLSAGTARRTASEPPCEPILTDLKAAVFEVSPARHGPPSVPLSRGPLSRASTGRPSGPPSTPIAALDPDSVVRAYEGLAELGCVGDCDAAAASSALSGSSTGRQPPSVTTSPTPSAEDDALSDATSCYEYEDVQWRYERRVRELYVLHAPDKLKDIEGIFVKYDGFIDQLARAVKEKYAAGGSALDQEARLCEYYAYVCPGERLSAAQVAQWFAEGDYGVEEKFLCLFLKTGVREPWLPEVEFPVDGALPLAPSECGHSKASAPTPPPGDAFAAAVSNYLLTSSSPGRAASAHDIQYINLLRVCFEGNPTACIDTLEATFPHSPS